MFLLDHSTWADDRGKYQKTQMKDACYRAPESSSNSGRPFHGPQVTSAWVTHRKDAVLVACLYISEYAILCSTQTEKKNGARGKGEPRVLRYFQPTLGMRLEKQVGVLSRNMVRLEPV